VGAKLIDALILSVIPVVAWFALTETLGGPCFGGGVEINGECRGFIEESKQDTWYLLVALNTLLSIGVLWIMQGLTGKTPGKAVVGIKVVNAEGNPPGVGRAALRSILGIVDAFPYFLWYLVGFIVALTSERNQRVGDMAAGTFVVDKKAVSPTGPAGGGQQQFASPGPAAGGFSGPPQYAQQPAQQSGGGAKADWYPDPRGEARLRYWDGQSWTEHTSQ
jgi:uncharacterized RDD family membrane protein YckC